MMKKAFALVDVSLPVEEKHPCIDYNKCVICQKETGEPLSNPKNNTRGHTDEGYKSLVTVLESYHDMGQLSSLPFPIDLTSLNDNGIGILNTLVNNSAMYHRSCKRFFSNSRLQRAEKRVQAASDPSKSKCPSPIKTRKTTTPFEKNTCIFCNGAGTPKYTLCKVQTLSTSNKIIDYAQKMNDSQTLAKLQGAVDLIALGAEYHTACLTNFYNKMRSYQAGNSEKSRKRQELYGYALAALIDYINDVKNSSGDKLPVFKMAQLSKIYGDAMKDLGMEASIHSSRLKERILEACPYLEAVDNPGQDTLITFRNDVNFMIRSSATRDFDTDALELLHTANIVRSDIFEHKQCNWEDMNPECQEECVPTSLRTLVKMILTGPSSIHCSPSEQDVDSDQVVSTISQLLFYHANQRTRNETTRRRHDARRETPVTVYLAMKIYGESRSKNLVKITHGLGLSISYDRLQSIITDRANRVCSRYHEENVVCPPSLARDVFTTAAADNIDHDTSSTTAKTSFHGTAISLMQHLLPGESGSQRNPINIGENRRKVMELPPEYAIVKPCFLNVKNAKFAPVEICSVHLSEYNDPLAQEVPWLKRATENTDACIPWSAFHAAENNNNIEHVTTTALMPIFTDQAHTTAMMLHSMNVVKDAIAYLNPQQVPVMVVDQPLYALCKQIQYLLPETHGKDKFFIFLGGLHIEMAAFRAAGHWLDGSGWVNVLTRAEVTTSGRAESMLKASHLTRTRYTHQVTAAALYSLREKAYESYRDDPDGNDSLTFTEWHDEQCKTIPQYKYWNIVLNLELTIFQFIRSIRSANFSLYKESLTRLVPWFFALDQVNYARWLSVHIADLVEVESVHPELAAQFNAGKFVARKTNRPFSAIALDQMHEQLNADLKGDGGMVGLTESADALRKWMLAGPEVATMVRQFETNVLQLGAEEILLHHSDTPSARKKFRSHVQSMVIAIEDLGNPFMEETRDLYNIDTKLLTPPAVIDTVMNIESIGSMQYKNFVEQRLKSSERSLMDTIKQNKLPIFTASATTPVVNKNKAKLAGLKNDCALFGRLFIACQSRCGDLDDFFTHENQSCPPALSTGGQMRSCTKSDLVQCLTGTCSNSTSTQSPSVHAKIYDGAALVHMLSPGTSIDFKEYFERIFLPYLKNECHSGVQRIDVVWDRYEADSLKNGTREKRGRGSRTRVLPSTKIPKGSWASFLRESSNKTELFEMLALSMKDALIPGVILVSTFKSDVLISGSAEKRPILMPCNHEEADTRLILHVADAVDQGYCNVMVRTTDTDVLVLCIAYAKRIEKLDKLWVSMGTGRNHQFIAAHTVSEALGPEKSFVLPTFHAVTGCDTVSSFGGKGKKTAFDVWQAYPMATTAFHALASGNIADGLDHLQAYVVALYDRTGSAKTVNECRRKLFTRKSRQLEAIPPTLDALEQHLKRAAHQGGFVWGQCLEALQILPDPSLWGWRRSENKEFWEPVWTTIPLVQEALLALTKCGCKKECTSRCKCIKANLKCTELCECGGCLQRE